MDRRRSIPTNRINLALRPIRDEHHSVPVKGDASRIQYRIGHLVKITILFKSIKRRWQMLSACTRTRQNYRSVRRIDGGICDDVHLVGEFAADVEFEGIADRTLAFEVGKGLAFVSILRDDSEYASCRFGNCSTANSRDVAAVGRMPVGAKILARNRDLAAGNCERRVDAGEF